MYVWRTVGTLALTLLCRPSGVPQVPAQTGRPEARALLALERRWLAAEDNPDTLDVILADDFIHVLPSGFITKRQQIDYLRRNPASRHEVKRFEDLHVRIYGSAGVVTGIVVATAVGGGIRRTAFTDVFVRRGGRWQAVNAQELSLR